MITSISDYNESKQTITIAGQSVSIRYARAFVIPVGIKALGWRPSAIVEGLEAIGAPLGSLRDLAPVYNFLLERQEARERAEKERLERERVAHYNSPEQVAIRKQKADQLHRERLEQAARIRGQAGNRSSRAGDVDYMPTAMFSD
ncbi:hypothetical protein HNP12_003773 [Aeromonas hydrophila]|uniref:hypothetical protein n=1 Tax=Aeromonas hydrophila TaxID=644 RepID=UPI0021676959|nr:hypothetical protein [Aeromonas hydrophila]MCS3769651.1 hypothetical protein [Aeromonas hydrophila]